METVKEEIFVFFSENKKKQNKKKTHCINKSACNLLAKDLHEHLCAVTCFTQRSSGAARCQWQEAVPPGSQKHVAAKGPARNESGGAGPCLFKRLESWRN